MEIDDQQATANTEGEGDANATDNIRLARHALSEMKRPFTEVNNDADAPQEIKDFKMI